jgi:hypothetical protein
MSDVDLFYTDSSVFGALIDLGYNSNDKREFDLANIDPEYLEWIKTQSHHLPEIGTESHLGYIELHHQLVHSRAVSFCREVTLAKVTKIPNFEKLTIPHPIDQLVLNVLHSTYGDMFTNHAKHRLRNVLEGYLLYRRLSLPDRKVFEAHFESIGRINDILFWKYLCVKLFDANEFSSDVSLKTKARFAVHDFLGQNSVANATVFWFYLFCRFFNTKMSNKYSRRIFFRKMLNRYSTRN